MSSLFIAYQKMEFNMMLPAILILTLLFTWHSTKFRCQSINC